MKDPLEEASADVDRRGASIILFVIVAGLVALAVFKPSSRDALAIIAGIVLMVMLHEMGHYLAAKRTGMKATEFFLGFGPRLWSFRRGETEFGVKAIMLGGYVRIIGMTNVEEVDPADEPRTYRRASYKHRLIVVLVGVTVNVMIALVLFFAFFAIQGRVYEGPGTTIRQVVTTKCATHGCAAKDAGFQKGDQIVSVEGEQVSGWDDLVTKIEARPNTLTTFIVLRNGVEQRLQATLGAEQGRGFLGVSPRPAYRSVNPVQAVPESFRAVGDVTAGTATGLAHLFSPSGLAEYGKNFTSDAPKAGTPAADARPRSLIGIVDTGSSIVAGDWVQLLWLLGAISLILAIFNVLPLLPFDGGHAAIVVYEAIASKVKKREVRVDYRKLMPMTAVVLAIFLMLGLSAMFLDIRDAVGS